MKKKIKEKIRITCIECGKERHILPQNKSTVRRCIYCQAIKNQEMNTALVRKRRAEKKKKPKKENILKFN